MSIVLSGVTGLRNRGVEALVASSVQQLRRLVPTASVVMLTKDMAFDRLRAAELQVDLLQDLFFKQTTMRKFKTAAQAVRGRKPQNAAQLACLRSARAVLATGGDVFSADYGDPCSHLRPLEYALQHQVPVFFLAHSIGPFGEPAVAQRVAKVLSSSTLVTVRESHSYKYVVDELRVAREKVIQTADPAFLLEPADSQRVSALRGYYGLQDDVPTVTLAVSQGICKFGELRTEAEAEQLAQEHLQALAAVARHVLEALQCQLLVIPHVQESAPHFDDRLMAEALLEEMERDPRVRVAWGNHTAAEFKGLISRSDLLIAERMHAAIAGLSTMVPTCVVRYSVKADGIMGDLFDEDERDCAMIRLEDFLDCDRARQVVQAAWQQRTQLRQTLQKKIPPMQELARKNFELIATCLGS